MRYPMKSLLIAALLLLSAQTVQAEIWQYGQGFSTRCGEFIYGNQPPAYVESWVAGYITAVNEMLAARNIEQIIRQTPSWTELIAMVCSQDLNMTITQATQVLVKVHLNNTNLLAKHRKSQ